MNDFITVENERMILQLFKNLPTTFFLQIKIRVAKWNDYVMIQILSYMKTCLRNGRKGKMGKINYEMDNITSRQFFLHWLWHDISMALRNFRKFCTFDQQTLIGGCYFKHRCILLTVKDYC